MEIKPIHFAIALAALFLALLALSPMMSPGKAQPPDYAMQAQEIYLRGVSYGENASAYTYAYTEYSNGFPENYILESDGTLASVDVRSALSDKKAYFLGNDTILCVEFSNSTACSSVKNESAAQSYLAAQRSRLFDGAVISTQRLNDIYMINKSMITFSPALSTRVLADGKNCTEIDYMIDYRNATLGDLNRFGIGAGAPQLFSVTSCIGVNGERLDYSYNTTVLGKPFSYRSVLINADFNARPVISAPNLSGDAMELAFSESAYRGSIGNCYQKQNESAKDECVAMFALKLQSTGVCSLAGSRQDRCLVSLMPYLRDPAVCLMIATPEYRDDCYIELGGAFKNSTWCGKVVDLTKKSYCVQVSSPIPPGSPAQPQQNETQQSGNMTQNGTVSIPPHVQDIFNSLENQSAGNNTANSTNGTGAG